MKEYWLWIETTSHRDAWMHVKIIHFTDQPGSSSSFLIVVCIGRLLEGNIVVDFRTRRLLLLSSERSDIASQPGDCGIPVLRVSFWNRSLWCRRWSPPYPRPGPRIVFEPWEFNIRGLRRSWSFLWSGCQEGRCRALTACTLIANQYSYLNAVGSHASRKDVTKKFLQTSKQTNTTSF